jgi:hypothetical protein
MSTLFISLNLITGLLSTLNHNRYYLDPGSGSFILQLIIAAFLGALFVLRGYLNNIINFFRRNTNDNKDEKRELDDE